MTHIDYRNPDVARDDASRAKRRLARRTLSTIAIAAAVITALACFGFWWRSSVHNVRSGQARADVDALLGPLAPRVRTVEAAYRWDGRYDGEETRWYRLTVDAGGADALVADLEAAWRRRIPQAAEGGVARMGSHPPTYDVDQGAEAAAHLRADGPSWWTPPPPDARRVLSLTDTDEFYSHLARWHPYHRFTLAYAPGGDIVFLRENRSDTRYPIVTPAGGVPATGPTTRRVR